MFNNTKHTASINNAAGFTFLEMMIALAIGIFLLTGFYSSYITQKKIFITQDHVAAMQQNLRSAITPIVNAVRMAGYNPTGQATCPGFKKIKAGRMEIYADLNGDGDCNDAQEIVEFGFPIANDSNDDGVPNHPAPLGRQYNNTGGYHSIGDNIASIEFFPLDEKGQYTNDMDKVRMVKISILAITDKPDPDFTNDMTYQPASVAAGGPTVATWKNSTTVDGFRRRLLITTVTCRNMGL